jgi:hypothetical protein
MRGCVLVDTPVHQSPLQDAGMLGFAVPSSSPFVLLFFLRSYEEFALVTVNSKVVHSPFVFPNHMSQRL